MPDYSKNFLNSMTGYMSLADLEDPGDVYIPKLKTSLDLTADVRDILANVIGGNYRNWSDLSGNEQGKAQYGALISRLGRPLATKIITQAILFNSRPELKGKGLEERIQSFYDIGSSDKDIANVMTNVKSFSQGVVPGLRESSNYGNQVLTGRSGNDIAKATDQSKELKKNLSEKLK